MSAGLCAAVVVLKLVGCRERERWERHSRLETRELHRGAEMNDPCAARGVAAASRVDAGKSRKTQSRTTGARIFGIRGGGRLFAWRGDDSVIRMSFVV